MEDKNNPLPPLILVVDDEQRNVRLLQDMLTGYGYRTAGAADGAQALRYAAELAPDLVFLDVMMPVMDGFSTCLKLKSDDRTKHIPVIMVTALTDRESRLRALEAGANDFLTKPIDKTELLVRAKNLLKIKDYEDRLKNYTLTLESKVTLRTKELERALTTLKQTNIALEASHVLLQQSYLDTINRLTNAAECKDEDTTEHIRRVAFYCAFIAKRLGWGEEQIRYLMYASPMHDIGKIAIPSDILLKPGKLSREEWALMQTHALAGAKIVQGSSSAYLQMAERIARSHHERYDGTGYPDGLKGDAIPLEAQIMSIVDQYDALRSRRPYKEAFSHARSVEIITLGDGRTMPQHFSPAVLQAFQSCHEEFAHTYARHNDKP